ncbi:large ribosomal subunit protein mL65 [Euwallacea fornicatus]|uniref:large ribosomal subunit protein mL65 n=1 Tax=Euwallacea fornicatus TaxID=995702 RepID=UPI00338D807A
MSLIRIQRSLRFNLLPKSRCFSTPVIKEEEEYTATPQYPPILDLSYEKTVERRNEALFEQIRNVKTVEEKQIKLNMPRYYGFKIYTLREELIPYDDLTFAQHVTRTHLIEDKELPKFYQNIPVKEDTLGSILKAVEELVLMEIEGIKKFYDLKSTKLSNVERENLLASSIVKGLNRVLTTTLTHEVPHIKNTEVDIDARLESTWAVGGMNPPQNVKKSKEGHEFFKKFANDPVDRIFCYIGSPILTLRSDLPLPYVISPSEAENQDFNVPFFHYDPTIIGEKYEYRRITNIPGFWPADSHTFGLISYLKTGHMIERNNYYTDLEDIKNATHRQAVLSSFAWLHGQANYLGFTTYNDITYPLIAQTVLTNGKEFQFYVYQMNTILVHGKNCKENPKRNVCWASNKIKLYEEVNNGKIVGLNEEVLINLIKMYKIEPKERLGVNLRPYLNQEEKVVADYQDDDKRKWLEDQYKFLTSNRPRHIEMDEYYSWEKIYKIDHNTRQMDKKMRFFEFFEKPWNRKLNDMLPVYIPRALRPNLPRHKGRRAKTYWP